MASLPSSSARLEDRVSVDVLVVSSNAKLRAELMEKLCQPRWRVHEASGGAEALARLREQHGNDPVLLLDQVLPDLNAGEFLRIVRERFPNTQILMLNSFTGQLLVGNASPTAISRSVVDAVNRAGSLRTETLRPNDVENREADDSDVVRLRSMVGDSEPMLRTYSLTAHGCSSRYHGAGYRRERNRQGSDCAGDSPDQPTPQPAVCGGELLRDSRDAAGSGAVWLYQRVLHRRGAVAHRAHSRGPRRHAVSR